MVRHVLVTGATGRVGLPVVRHLRAQGIAVTAGADRAHPDLVAERICLGDVTSEQVVTDLLGEQPAHLPPLDAVVHLAALPHRDAGPPMAVYRTNVLATFNVLTKAAEAGIERAVIASSINAFGVPMNNHDVLPAYYPIDVHTPADIADWYSLSKASDELTAAMVVRRWGMTIIALRLPFTHDEDGIAEYSGFCTRDPRLGLRDGWSYLHVRDAGRAVQRGLTADVAGCHVLHVAAPDTTVPYHTEDLLDRYAPHVERRRALPGRTTGVDVTTARDLLNFEADWSIDLTPIPLPPTTE